MGTMLVVSTQIPAHTLNASKLVSGVIKRGHRVVWVAELGFREHVERCGATHIAAPNRSPAVAWQSPQGPASLVHVRRLYRDLVAGDVTSHLTFLDEVMARHDFDLVLSDTLSPAAGLAAARHCVPWATFGDGPLLWWDEETPPFGTGLTPMRGVAGRHRNRNVQRVVDRALFRPAVNRLSVARTQVGLAEAASIRDATMSNVLHLQGCSPSLEYPRLTPPPHVHFVGALGTGPVGPPPPAALRRRTRQGKLVVITQGTLRRDLRELVQPACEVLVEDGWQVLVAGAADGAWNRHGTRVTAMEWVDYDQALAEADLFITNGGYTGVTLAAAAGVPVIRVGASEEKPDVGARVEWAGIGAGLRTQHPSPRRLRQQIRRVMNSPERQRASDRVACEAQQYRAEELGADLLERLLVPLS